MRDDETVSNRRKLRLTPHRATAPVAGYEWLPEKRPPWNKGLTLTATPSVSTLRREARAMEAGGLVEITTARTGKPGRPPHLISPTKKSWAVYDICKRLEAVRWDTRILSPREVDMLISAGYAARRDDGTVAFLEDYQAWWKYWNSKRGGAEHRAAAQAKGAAS